MSSNNVTLISEITKTTCPLRMVMTETSYIYIYISNCGYYRENMSAFLDFLLQPLAQAVKLYIKDTNHFLNKLCSLPKLPDNIILCVVYVVGLYPNISHKEGLSAHRKRLDNQMEKYISSGMLCDLAGVVLENNISKFGKNTKKNNCNQNEICTSL